MRKVKPLKISQEKEVLRNQLASKSWSLIGSRKKMSRNKFKILSILLGRKLISSNKIKRTRKKN